jgi:hypothetical protein
MELLDQAALTSARAPADVALKSAGTFADSPRIFARHLRLARIAASTAIATAAHMPVRNLPITFVHFHPCSPSFWRPTIASHTPLRNRLTTLSLFSSIIVFILAIDSSFVRTSSSLNVFSRQYLTLTSWGGGWPVLFWCGL